MNIEVFPQEVQAGYQALSPVLKEFIDHAFAEADIRNIPLALHVDATDSLSIIGEDVVIGAFSGYFVEPVDYAPKRIIYFNAYTPSGAALQYDMSRQCANIPIWETDALLSAAGYCCECGTFVGIQNLKHYLTSCTCCEECFSHVQREMDSEVSGY